MEPNAVV
jgi:hypothetical protein